MDYFLAIIGAFAVILVIPGVRRITVFEYEKGLKYTNGKFESILEPGRHWYMAFYSHIHKLDVRPRFVSITGQEIVSADGVALKVSLAANFEIIDPHIAINKVQSFQESLYLELQLALREIIGAAEIDAVLSGRSELANRLMEITKPKAAALGLKLISADLKDIIFPGKLKEVFAQVVSAKKESLAALEKARGETAALRNLANAAKMIEGNSNLMQLRIMQAFGESSGNTLVLGMPSQTVPIPVQSGKTPNETKPESPEGS